MSLDRYRRPRMIVLRPDSTAYDAARAMAEHRIASLLVCQGHEIVGIVTDRDLLLEIVAGDLDPYRTRLHEIMSRDVATLDINATLADVTRLMRERACRRIPITEDGKPVGLVTLDDLLIDGEFSQGTRLAVAAQLDAATLDRGQVVTSPGSPRMRRKLELGFGTEGAGRRSSASNAEPAGLKTGLREGSDPILRELFTPAACRSA